MDTAADNTELLGRFELGRHRYATRTTEAIDGADRQTGEKGLVWILRTPLSERGEEFSARLRRIEQLPLPKPQFLAFGVANQNGYLITEFIGGNKFPLIEDPFDRKLELFRRAIECVAMLHDAGVVLGDICEDTFIVRPSGELCLAALLGSYEKGRPNQAPPSIVYNFISPEQRAGMPPSPQADVFALGMIAYRLFTGLYPEIKSISRQLDPGEDPLAKAVPPSVQRESCPLWLDSYIGVCLSVKLTERFGDATVALAAFDKAASTGQCSLPGRWANYDVVVRGKTTGVLKIEKGESPSAYEEKTGDSQTHSEDEKPVTTSKLPRYLFLGVFGLILGVLAFGTVAVLRGGDPKSVKPTIDYVELLPPELQAAAAVVIDKQASVKERIDNLERIASNDSPATYSVLSSLARLDATSGIRPQAIQAAGRRLKDLGYNRSAELLESWTNGVISQGIDPAVSPLLGVILRSCDLTLPLQIRRDGLHKAFVDDRSLALRLAAALGFDDPDEEHFVPALRQLLHAAGVEGDLSKLHLPSLITLNRVLLAAYERDIPSLLARAKPGELAVMLEALAQADHLLVYDAAQEVLRRRSIDVYQAIPLKALVDADRLQTGRAIKIALVRLSRGEIQEEDVGTIGRWLSLEFEPVLLSVAAKSKDRGSATIAIEVLAGRGASSSPAQELLSWVQSSKMWASRRELAQSLGILGLHKLATDEEIAGALEPLMPYAVSGKLLEIFVNYGDARLISMLLDRVAQITGSDTLLKLTKHADPAIRISAVRALQGRNEVRVLQDLVRGYERERDPNVRKVYEENHWVVKNR